MNNIASSQERFPAIEEAVTPLLLDSQNLYKEFRKIKKEHFTSKRQRKETAKLAEIWKVERNIRRAIQPLAQPLCLEICEGVCKRLPREIRDTIYEFLYAHDTIYVGPEYFTKTTRPCIASRKAHIWDDVYVGQGMQREIVESWYRTTLFYFYDKAANVEVIERFLRTDRWDLGIEPKDFICHTRVELWMDSVLHHRRCCVVKDAGPKLIEALKNFENLPNHVEFLIRIHTYDAPNTECMSKGELKDAIRVVVKELEKLHKEGHRLIIQWPDLKNAELSWKKDPFSVDGWIKKLEVAACLAPAEPDEKSLSDEEETAVWEWNDGVLDAGNISFAGA